MVDFQSRDTRRGPPLDDDDDEPDEEGSPPDETAAEDPSAETPTEEPQESESAREGSDGDPVGGNDNAAADDAAEPGNTTAGPSSPPADDGAPSSRTPADEGTSPSAGGGDTPATDPLDDRAGAPSPAGEATADSGALAETAADGEAATPETAIGVAVVTVGDGGPERIEDTIAAAFESAGHTITVRERLRGEYDTLQQVVDRLVSRADVDAVVTAGGIGIAADERTIEAVHPLFAKALPGFGEAFRALLFEEIGTGIVGVRSTAGVADGTLVFCLPGDTEAAGLAVEEIIVPEAPKLVAHLR